MSESMKPPSSPREFTIRRCLRYGTLELAGSELRRGSSVHVREITEERRAPAADDSNFLKRAAEIEDGMQARIEEHGDAVIKFDPPAAGKYGCEPPHEELLRIGITTCWKCNEKLGPPVAEARYRRGEEMFRFLAECISNRINSDEARHGYALQASQGNLKSYVEFLERELAAKEADRVSEWNKRREAEGSLDASNAAIHSLREELSAAMRKEKS